jgi:hypothetical protein
MSDLNTWLARAKNEGGLPTVRTPLRLVDGTLISIQCSDFHYSLPDGDLSSGDYTHFEVRLFDQPVHDTRPIRAILAPFADDPADTVVYKYVPRVVVERVLKKGGGISALTVE